MATNAGPVYGKQYIRFAETYEARIDGAAGDGTGEIGEFRVVVQIQGSEHNTVCAKIDIPGGANAEYVGVNQAYMPSALASPQTARQVTVATAGLLLVEFDPTADFNPNTLPTTQLYVNDLGQAVDSGFAGASPVVVAGTTPIIRDVVAIGGRRMVLVSFL